MYGCLSVLSLIYGVHMLAILHLIHFLVFIEFNHNAYTIMFIYFQTFTPIKGIMVSQPYEVGEVHCHSHKHWTAVSHHFCFFVLDDNF